MNTIASTGAHGSNGQNDGTARLKHNMGLGQMGRSVQMSTRFLAHPRFLMAATFVWPTVSMHFAR